MSLSEDLIADVDGITVTNEALNAAMAKIPDRHISLGHWEPGVSHEDMRAALESAAPHIAAAERERIRQLAVDHDAMFLAAVPVPPDYGVSEIETPFADLLGESVTEPGDPADEPGQKWPMIGPPSAEAISSGDWRPGG